MKSIMRYHLIPVKVAIGKKESLGNVAGNATGIGTMENSIKGFPLPPKIKN